jgi:hypothetical protein
MLKKYTGGSKLKFCNTIIKASGEIITKLNVLIFAYHKIYVNWMGWSLLFPSS